MVDSQQVDDYAEKFLSHLDPGRLVHTEESEKSYHVTYTDSEGNPLRGGFMFAIDKGTGDVLNMSQFGSGSGYVTLMNCIDKFHNDADFRDLLRVMRVIVGNVKEDVFNEQV